MFSFAALKCRLQRICDNYFTLCSRYEQNSYNGQLLYEHDNVRDFIHSTHYRYEFVYESSAHVCETIKVLSITYQLLMVTSNSKMTLVGSASLLGNLSFIQTYKVV
jgi:hypothetical protein